jgi:CubicO group peptidase (beta-lactamase class C family)
MAHRGPSARTLSLLAALGWVVPISACEGDPAGIQDRFPEAGPQGIDPAALARVYEQAEGIPGLHSLLVQRHGVLVAEDYFHGFEPDSLHDVRSVTKSVVSILTGIAVEEGYIGSIDQTLGELLPGLAATLPVEKSRISVRDLLMMSSGLDWHELDGGSSYGDWWASGDMLQFILDLPVVHEPGERFIYNSGASHLLSVILTEATGQTTLQFAREHVFSPLGITDVDWLLLPDGYYAGGMGLQIDARAMMRIGQMFLDGGTYGGVSVVSADWVTQSTTGHLSTGGVMPFGQEYGYLWWMGQSEGLDFYFANGYGGQFILVDPDLDLVVVASSRWRGLNWQSAGSQWYSIIDLIVTGVLPSVRE